MNQHLLLAPQPTNKRLADVNGPDFYPTPTWATGALMESEAFSGKIWECACGDGAMSEALKGAGNEADSSDLFDRGYGEPGVNFLTETKMVENIITNPPFNSAEAFLEAGLRQSSQKLALLLRLAFLKGARRQRNIFSVQPRSRV